MNFYHFKDPVRENLGVCESGRSQKCEEVPTVRSWVLYIGFLLFLFSLFVPSIANASNYYVSTDGSDSNPGSESQPWRNIQKAADTMVAGDTVYIRAGTYYPTTRIIPKNSGNATSGYITYTNYANEKPVIDGTNTEAWGSTGLFSVDPNRAGASGYIRIKGLTFINAKYYGIFAKDANHVLIENNITNVTPSSGIKIHASSNVVIDGNQVQHACGNGDQENISVGNSSSYIEVKNNEIFNPDGKEQIDIKGGCMHCSVHNNYIHDIGNRGFYGVGIYIDAYSELQQDINVFNNRINCDDDLSTGGRTMAMGIAMSSEQPVGGVLDGVKVYNNIVSNCGESGAIKVTNWCTDCNPDSSGNTTGIKRNIIIANNTTFNNYGPGIDIQTGSRAENIKVYNNIAYNNTLGQIRVGSDVASQTTLSNNLTTNPLFINTSSIASYDFKLQSGSPAINAGMVVPDIPNIDYDGNTRPQGTLWDIGAYEYGGTTSTTPPTYNPADTEPDGDVDFADFNSVVSHFGQTGVIGWIRADIIKNGVINIFDFNKLITNFGQ